MSDMVSIVMPAYNASGTIEAAISSVLGQTYQNFELVIVDDASTDNTSAIVEKYSDRRIKFFSQVENRGEGATRDVAIARSTGDWIAVLDADDAWKSDRLQKMLSLEPHITGKYILVDNLMQCYEKDGEMIPWKPLWSGKSQLMSKSVLSLCDYLALPRFIVTPLFPREAIHEHQVKHSNLKFGADSEFIVRLLKLADLKIKVCPEPMYLYRLTPGSASSVTDRNRILKEMLVKLESDLNFTEEELAAIEYRKSRLDRQNEYMKMLLALREKRYFRVIRLFFSHSYFFCEFCRRLPHTIRYKLALYVNGGKGR